MTRLATGEWYLRQDLVSRQFTCGHCGNNISSQLGYKTTHPGYSAAVSSLYICHVCNCPSLFYDGNQVPGPLLGGKIDNLPEDINLLYKEIQNSTSTGSFTAAVLAARKLLMHIAVECGAVPGKKFAFYVDYLVENNYTPPNSKNWIDRIRSVGNEANHEIVIMKVDDAATIIRMVEMLLKFNYEFPALVSESE